MTDLPISERFAHLPHVPPAVLHERRERVFLVVAGLFLGTLAMLNILGITRFIIFANVPTQSWGTLSFAVAVGVLPYPMTFLCTDIISEFYGRKRANFVVWVGLLLNLWVMAILWLGGVLPGTESPAFFTVRTLAFGAVTASMLAYLAAQFCDVYIFHFWKNLTRGRHLWLRNNGSTMVSQIVDTVSVILITYWIGGLDELIDANPQTAVATLLITIIATSYAFKFIAALIDTPVIYAVAYVLGPYLRIDPTQEHHADREEMRLK